MPRRRALCFRSGTVGEAAETETVATASPRQRSSPSPHLRGEAQASARLRNIDPPHPDCFAIRPLPRAGRGKERPESPRFGDTLLLIARRHLEIVLRHFGRNLSIVSLFMSSGGLASAGNKET